MAEIKLYGMIASPNVFRVALALEEKSIQYTINDQIMSEEFLKKSRWGLMPCLEIDGTPRAESLALLEWIEDKYPEKPLMPKDADQKALVRSWIHRIQNSILSNRFTKVFNPQGAEQAQTNLKGALNDLNQELKNKQYIVGDTYTLADCQMAIFYVGLDQLKDIVGITLEDYPEIKKHKELVTARDSFKKIDPSEMLAGFIKNLSNPEEKQKMSEGRLERMQKWKSLREA